MTIYLGWLKPHCYAILRFCESGKPENQINAFFLHFFAKKFAKYNLFIVYLHRISERDTNHPRSHYVRTAYMTVR